jgi:hypothetical protein
MQIGIYSSFRLIGSTSTLINVSYLLKDAFDMGCFTTENNLQHPMLRHQPISSTKQGAVKQNGTC